MMAGGHLLEFTRASSSFVYTEDLENFRVGIIRDQSTSANVVLRSSALKLPVFWFFLDMIEEESRNQPIF